MGQVDLLHRKGLTLYILQPDDGDDLLPRFQPQETGHLPSWRFYPDGHAFMLAGQGHILQ